MSTHSWLQKVLNVLGDPDLHPKQADATESRGNDMQTRNLQTAQAQRQGARAFGRGISP